MSSTSSQLTHAGRNNKFRPIALLMNLWVYGALIVVTVTMALLSPLLLASLMFTVRWSPKKVTRFWIWVYGRAWTWIIRPFVSQKRLDLHKVKDTGPCILVINHLSFFDTFFMGMLPVFDVNLTLRSWPFKMFWYAMFMRIAQYLDLESLTYDAIIAQCKCEFKTGAYTLFFPEGHRSRDGKIQRFHSGAFKVAIDTKTPIIPLCITGTRTLLPPGENWLMPSEVTMKALDAVHPADFMDNERPHIALRKAVKQAMVNELEGKDDS